MNNGLDVGMSNGGQLGGSHAARRYLYSAQNQLQNTSYYVTTHLTRAHIHFNIPTVVIDYKLLNELG